MKSGFAERFILRRVVTRLIPLGPPLEMGVRSQVLDSTIRFVDRQIRIAPFHIRLGVVVLGWGLSMWLAVRAPGASGSIGASLLAERAVSQFERFATPCRSAVRLFRSMSLLAYYEHPAVAEMLGFPDATRRRDEYIRTRNTLRPETSATPG